MSASVLPDIAPVVPPGSAEPGAPAVQAAAASAVVAPPEAAVSLSSAAARPAGLVPGDPAEQPAPSGVVASAGEPASPDSDAGEEQQLDANRLHVYHVALELHTLCCTLVAALNRVVRDQLERASLSVVLNIAEAGGRRSRRDKARYYAIARGSATEVAALLDVLTLRRLASPASIRTARRLAIRCVQMLSRIDQRLVGRAE